MFTNSVSQAQKRVEGNNFDMRKTVLEYDDVMNKQREVIPSIYHWKQTFILTESEKSKLAENNIHKIYVRYFDIKLMNGKDILPVSSIKFEDKIEAMKREYAIKLLTREHKIKLIKSKKSFL